MLGLVLLVILILLLVGAIPAWPHSREWGYAPGGLLGTDLGAGQAGVDVDLKGADRDPGVPEGGEQGVVEEARRALRTFELIRFLNRHPRHPPTLGRQHSEFVPGMVERELDLLAGELKRVKDNHGAKAIYGGSYGWSSAGRVHHARSLLRRFLFLGGGCVDQVANYSFGAAQYVLPRVIGTFQPVVEIGRAHV